MASKNAPSSTAKLVLVGDRVVAIDATEVVVFDGTSWAPTNADGPVPASCCETFLPAADGAIGFVFGTPQQENQLAQLWRYLADGPSWEALPRPDVSPPPRTGGATVFFDDRLLLWGGGAGLPEWGCTGHFKACNHGALYDASARKWAPITRDGALSPRGIPVTVWTEIGVFLWGGASPEFEQADLRDGAILTFD